MNHKKTILLFSFLCLSLLSAAAQRNMYVLQKSGELKVYSVSPSDSMSFSTISSMFKLTAYDVSSVSENSFNASCKADRDGRIKNLGELPEVGVCFSDMNSDPTITDGKVVLGDALTDYTFSIGGLDEGTTYYYRMYVRLFNTIFYSNVCQTTTLGTKLDEDNREKNGHKFVDLALPSGLLWAVCNIGAGISADGGDYFAWGDTVPGHNCSWPEDWYSKGGRDSLANESLYGPDDDAATAIWGTSCRMPSADDFAELADTSNCTWKWAVRTTTSGSTVNGYEITSKRNGKSIFLPASGYSKGKVRCNYGVKGFYWSSPQHMKRFYYAYRIFFDSTGKGWDYRSCYNGLSVRPVAEP